MSFFDPVETLSFALTCSCSSHVAAKDINGGKMPPMNSKYMFNFVKDDRLEMIKWVRAQKPPCQCDFQKCVCVWLAKGGGARHVQAYVQQGLDLISKCRTLIMSKRRPD